MLDIFEHLQDKKHVIWDWNGTLLNDLTAVLEALNNIGKILGQPPIDAETYLAKFKFPVADFYKDIGYYTTDEEFAALSEDFHRYYFEALKNVDLFDGAKPVLEKVKSTGAKQSILTAAFQNHIDGWIHEYEIADHLDHVFGLGDKLAACKLTRGKELMNEAGVNASDSILIGDTDHDLKVGKELGVDVILVTAGHQSEARLSAAHDTVFVRH